MQNKVRPLPCFIDTQVFKQANFDLASTQLKLLGYLVKNRHIYLVLPDVTYCEIISHLKDKVDDEISQMQASAKKAKTFQFLEEVDEARQSTLRMSHRQAELCARIQNAFGNYLESLGLDRVDCRDIKVGPILEDFFSCRPPFTAKKKNEFKDAIAIRALKNYLEWHRGDLMFEELFKSIEFTWNEEVGLDARGRPKQLFVVSADDSFRHAFDGDERFVCFDSVSELARSFPEYGIAQQVVAIAKDKPACAVNQELVRAARIANYELSRLSGKATLMGVDVDVPDALILSIAEQSEGGVVAEVLWDAMLRLSVDLQYAVPETGVYVEAVSVSRRVSVTASIRCRWNNGVLEYDSINELKCDELSDVAVVPRGVDSGLLQSVRRGYVERFVRRGSSTRYYIHDTIRDKWDMLPFELRYHSFKKYSDNYGYLGEDEQYDNIDRHLGDGSGKLIYFTGLPVDLPESSVDIDELPVEVVNANPQHELDASCVYIPIMGYVYGGQEIGACG